MQKKHDVVITGMGVISPIGSSVEELVASLMAGRSGVRLFEPHATSKLYPAGVVDRPLSNEFTKLELPVLDRGTQMAVHAARQAIADARLGDFTEYERRAGVFYGTVRGGAGTEQEGYEQLLIEHKQVGKPTAMMAAMHNAAAAQISMRHQILGPVITHSTACASSGTAIGDAARAIRDGYLDVVVAGGADAALTPFMFAGFEGTRALAAPDPQDAGRSCRPFSKDRAGLVLGEGAAFFVLESAEHARKRGATCHASFSGYGISADGYSISHPKAEGQARAIRMALEDAGLQPSDIGYLNPHATATQGGDVVEAQAIHLAFGDAAHRVPVSATKSLHGHLLGAASALELMIAVVAITESFLPATAHLEEADPRCALNHVARTPVLDQPIERAMSFSTGFGGTNVALIVSKHPELPARAPLRSKPSH
jgi:3-oxoacyl-[acyl-carrier-protein] synthase II